ncbi:hypothetical protein [Paenibacillus sp. FSL L8-0323]|uniref:hypothetical protein n=1 Tax=unclassified Paenibacillus TaxID=185978 RepID=UPI0030F53AAF
MDWLSDLDWDILLSGLIGAFIGGVASILGGLWATNKNIKAQNEHQLMQEEKEKARVQLLIKVSAKMIYSDLLSAVFEARLVASSKKKPGGIPVGSQYSNHIANLIVEFEPDELASIYKIYGHIERLKTDFQNYNDENAFDHTPRNCRYFIKEIFGDNESFINKLGPNDIGYEEVVQYMRIDYKSLFLKLNNMYTSEAPE